MDNFIRPSSNCFVAAKAAKIKVPKRDETYKTGSARSNREYPACCIWVYSIQ